MAVGTRPFWSTHSGSGNLHRNIGSHPFYEQGRLHCTMGTGWGIWPLHPAYCRVRHALPPATEVVCTWIAPWRVHYHLCGSHALSHSYTPAHYYPMQKCCGRPGWVLSWWLHSSGTSCWGHQDSASPEASPGAQRQTLAPAEPQLPRQPPSPDTTQPEGLVGWGDLSDLHALLEIDRAVRHVPHYHGYLIAAYL